MNEKYKKVIVIVLCTISCFFGLLKLYNNRYDVGYYTVGMRVIIILANSLVVISSIMLILSWIKPNLTINIVSYVLLALCGIAGFFVRGQWLAGVLYSMWLISLFVIVSISAILLAFTVKTFKKIHLRLICLLLVAELLWIAAVAGVYGAFFVYTDFLRECIAFYSIIVAGLISNMNTTQKAKYNVVTSALEELKVNLDSGVITEEEYQTRKKDILTGI